MIRTADCIRVGEVAKTHGYNGELLLRAISGREAEDMMWDTLHIMIDGGLVPFGVTDVRERNDSEVLVSFDLVTTHQEASDLVGKEVWIERKWLEREQNEESDDETLVNAYDLVGFQLSDTTGDVVGIIRDADYTTPENPLFIVERKDKSEVYIPIVDDWITDINNEKHSLCMDLPMGLY